jgi:glycosyltransferase involved in cell wall biosynthesis
MTAPLRIGLLTPALTGYNAIDSGIGQHFADLALGLTALGHSVVTITPDAETGEIRDPRLTSVQFETFQSRMPPWLDRLTGFRWQIHSHAGLRHRVRAATQALDRAVLREKLSLIETTSSGVLATRYLRRHHRVPVVTRVSTTAAQLVSHNHAQARWPDRVEQRWEEQLVRASDCLVTHTVHHRDELCRAWNLLPAAFTIIPHGIALPPAVELGSTPAHAGIEILFAGRFEHRKGIDVLLAAIPRILAAEPSVRFTLIGHDPGQRYQAEFIATNPSLASERVRFLGKVSAEKLRAAYRSCDIFVGPSRYESFGLIYVEAMAWAKPVVACASGGTVEVVVDGETGWLVAPGEIDPLVAQTLALVRDDAMRTKFGRNARLRVETLYSRASLASKSADFYRDILTERAAKR